MLKYLISLLLTLAIEGCVTAAVSRKSEWLIYVCIVNVMTNPPANVLFNGLKPLLTREGRIALIIILEAVVILAEGFLFHLYRKKERRGLRCISLGKCMLWSLALNLLSYGLGSLINKVI